MNDYRNIVWFSCGIASAVMADIVKKAQPNAMLVRIWLGGESQDNNRFMSDIEQWLNCKVLVLKSKMYNDHFDVIEKTKYINGVKGARCTAELKKKVRFEFQQIEDVQYFGYTFEEQTRADRFRKSFPEVMANFPLIEAKLTKKDCGGILASKGIELPRMYRLGYNNNNCIGCVKGGKGYWNKIRKDFPAQFKRMAEIERKIGASCIKDTFLDELKAGEGRHKDFEISCDFVCQVYQEKQNEKI